MFLKLGKDEVCENNLAKNFQSTDYDSFLRKRCFWSTPKVFLGHIVGSSTILHYCNTTQQYKGTGLCEVWGFSVAEWPEH